MWFDSHCHLDFEAFDADRPAVWQRAAAAGVGEVFVPGVRASQWVRLPELCRACPGACFGLGLHPYFLHELTAQQHAGAILELRSSFAPAGAVAVGECGLDARVPERGGASLEQQVRVLEAQLDCARLLGAPVVLHVVGAHGRMLELLAQHPLPAGGVLHSYSGSAELVPRYAKHGLHFGFSLGVLRRGARRVLLALAAVPSERLLLETDAPDQAPEGPAVRNEPARLLEVGRAVAAHLGRDVTELARLTTANARRLFRRGGGGGDSSHSTETPLPQTPTHEVPAEEED